jgi:hypothetical protein
MTDIPELTNEQIERAIPARRNLSTSMRHSLVQFTEQFLLSLMVRVG